MLHEMAIGGRSFADNERAHELIAEGSRYRVYFVPIADVVVSLEPAH